MDLLGVTDTSVRSGGTVPWPPSDPKNKKMYKQYSAVAYLRGGKGDICPREQHFEEPN